MVKKSSGIDLILIPEVAVGAVILLALAVGYLGSAIIEAIRSTLEVDDLLNKGINLSEQDKYPEALIYLQRANKLDPDNLKVLFQIAFALFQINQGDKDVERYALRVLELNNEHDYSNLLLGAYYQYGNQSLKSLLYLKRIKMKNLIDDADRSYAFYLFGLAYRSLGDQEDLQQILSRLKNMQANDYVSKLQKDDQ